MKLREELCDSNTRKFCVLVKTIDEYNILIESAKGCNYRWDEQRMNAFRNADYVKEKIPNGGVCICLHRGEWADSFFYENDWGLIVVPFDEAFLKEEVLMF